MAESQPTSTQQEDGSDPRAPHAQTGGQTGKPLVWYCPSRWLLAHHDTQANICTQSSHMCLADLNNDGENLLALVDFKEAAPPADSAAKLAPGYRPPYACRMRVYRGQQLIYNHFLEDVPSSLIATSINLPLVAPTMRTKLGGLGGGASKLTDTLKQQTSDNQQQQPLLTLAINEDVYFYHKLKPSHKLSLEDEECILDSLNKSEVDAWEMARKNQIEDGTMRELLLSLSQELGNQALTSHSNNFIALASSDERKQYLVNWKLKRLSSSSSDRLGEQLMSMDTVCCLAARLRFNSTLTTSGDFGQTREQTTIMNNAKWNKIMDVQRDGLVLGTEDRHLLIYELRAIRTRLESHCRLPAVADHILVERRSPASFDATPPAVAGKQFDLRALTYKILISCRDRKIYSLDQPYLVPTDNTKSIPASALRELVALKSNVLDMCWTGMNEEPSDQQVRRGGSSSGAPGAEHHHRPTFLVACLDRRFYCFGSHSGQCKWIMEMELPITCLVCLPKLTIGCDEASLVGVASQANRFDFYVASSGRIVDSIYFQDDFPVAAKFGRFGREDNCLCLTTQRGHLLVFILKRTAKFGHGQCLSSAASYASDTLASCSKILKRSSVPSSRATGGAAAAPPPTGAEKDTTRAINMHEQKTLPGAFELSKSKSVHATDKILDSLILSHDCDQATAKSALDAHATRPQLQIPLKGRDFVNHIVDQSRLSRQTGRLFGKQMVDLRDKVKLALGQHQQQFCGQEVNRVNLVKITGLGNIYRVSLALRLNVADFITRYHDLLPNERFNSTSNSNVSPSWELSCYMTPKNEVRNRPCQVSPFKFKLPIEKDSKADLGIKSVMETPVAIKLLIRGQDFEPLDGDHISIEVKIIAHHLSPSTGVTTIQRPLYLAAINVPLTC